MQNTAEYEQTRPTRRSTQTDADEKTYFMGGVIVTQIAVTALLILTVFLIYRSHGARYDFLKNYYDTVMQRDYTASELIDSAHKVMASLTRPRDDSREQTEAETSDVKDAEDNETDELAAAGGEDLMLPKNNASFSPFYLSKSIYKPVDSQRITSRFGYRINPVTGKYGFHSGIDLAAEQGSNIYAALDGTVEKAEYSSARGNYIFLRSSDNILTVYCHCSELLVSAGQSVTAGDVIAKVGATGQATGPHLHFEIRINGSYYNPVWLPEFNEL